MHLRLCLLVTLSLSLAYACGGDDDGGTPSVDADPNAPDADPNAADADPDQADSGAGAAGEVPCGDGPACTSPEGCCVTGGKGGGDQTCATAEQCADGFFQECDGRNDCPGDDYCCLGGGGVSCTNADDCGIAICSTPADCPTEGDMCCMGEGDAAGACSATCGG